MRSISFALTTEQFRARSKTVTRRLGWSRIQPGTRLMGVVKAMGLKRGERQVKLGEIKVVSCRPEPLDAITADDVAREGFPDMTPKQFVEFFCEHNRVKPQASVNRIEFSYPPSGIATGEPAAPALKWPGGKTRLLSELERRLPGDVQARRHVELFAGGAALFFHRRPGGALLADTCGALTELYRALQADTPAVVRSLRGFARNHTREGYYVVRDRFNAGGGSNAQRAAMLLYLNRAGFNGLFRQNAAGEYNVPCGDAGRASLCQPERLGLCGAALAGALVLEGDFEATAKAGNVGRGDFVYLDPPYAPTCSGSFRGYVAGGFHYDDHVRLRDLAERLEGAGARVMISNSDTPFVRDIFRRWRVEVVKGPRSIAAKGGSRGKVRELVIRNYDGTK